MALDECLKTILCGIGSAAISMLESALQAQVLAAQAALAVIDAEIIQADILGAPFAVAAQLVQEVVDEAKGVLNIVPLNLIGTCTDLGELNVSIRQQIDDYTAEAVSVLNDAAALLSYSDELRALKAELQDLIAYYTDVKLVLETCTS